MHIQIICVKLKNENLFRLIIKSSKYENANSAYNLWILCEFFPLYEVIKHLRNKPVRSEFIWFELCDEHFCKFKNAIGNAILLVYPIENGQFNIMLDQSEFEIHRFSLIKNYAIIGIFFSKKLSTTEKKINRLWQLLAFIKIKYFRYF